MSYLSELYDKYITLSENGVVSFENARKIAQEIGVDPNNGFDHMIQMFRTDPSGISYERLKLAISEITMVRERLQLMEQQIVNIAATTTSGRCPTDWKLRIMKKFYPVESHEELTEILTTWPLICQADCIKLMQPNPQTGIEHIH
jgi:hypothetical protein